MLVENFFHCILVATKTFLFFFFLQASERTESKTTARGHNAAVSCGCPKSSKGRGSC